MKYPWRIVVLSALALAGCTGGYRAVGTPSEGYVGATFDCSWKWGHTAAGKQAGMGMLFAPFGAIGGAMTAATAAPIKQAAFMKTCMAEEGWAKQ